MQKIQINIIHVICSEILKRPSDQRMETCITKLGNSIRISSKSAKYLDQETNHQTIMLGSCMVKLQ